MAEFLRKLEQIVKHEGDGGGGTGNPDPNPDPDPDPDPDPGQTFTQAQVNSFLKKEREKDRSIIKQTKEQLQQHVEQLNALKQEKGLSEAQKDKLQERINEIKNQYLTKEQQLEQEKEEAVSTLEANLTASQKEAAEFKNLFETTTKNNAISDAATKYKAFNPIQLQNILAPQVEVVPSKDEEGNLTGSWEARTKINTVNKDGEKVTLDVTVDEAVKMMKDTPESYGNLFIDPSGGGGGGYNMSTNEGGEPDFTKMTQPEYKAWREKNK